MLGQSVAIIFTGIGSISCNRQQPDIRLSEKQILGYVINEIMPIGDINFAGFPLTQRDEDDIIAYTELKFDAQ